MKINQNFNSIYLHCNITCIHRIYLAKQYHFKHDPQIYFKAWSTITVEIMEAQKQIHPQTSMKSSPSKNNSEKEKASVKLSRAKKRINCSFSPLYFSLFFFFPWHVKKLAKVKGPLEGLLIGPWAAQYRQSTPNIGQFQEKRKCWKQFN